MTRQDPIAFTPENRALVEQITGKADTRGKNARRLIVVDGVLHRPNGRFIVGNVPVIDQRGRIVTARDEDGHAYIVTRRHRFRIPRRHPWRGSRS
ncbi:MULTISPECIES: hypothetical protein [unclassified Microbacterium]|uniref:hypothetical protein n=1 Tax=unclassified Microbacterium TaxID=2609290 RepID=UPI00300FEED5